VVFGILEMVTADDMNYKKFGILKIFRIFRVFRVAKVLRRVKAMRNIINGINKSISNILYTLSLVFLFILIFILLGNSLLKDIPDFNDKLYTFYIVFQALTVENYNGTIYNYFQ